jgi:hypothetical protein
MDNLENEFVYIHQEFIMREAKTHQALKQVRVAQPPLIDRASTSLGEALIQLGTRLKERKHDPITAEESSAPSYLIML